MTITVGHHEYIKKLETRIVDLECTLNAACTENELDRKDWQQERLNWEITARENYQQGFADGMAEGYAHHE